MSPFLRSLFRVFRKPPVIGWLVFSVLLLTVSLLSYQRYLLFEAARTRELNNAALNAREKLQSALNYSLTATKTLSFLITRYNGEKDFDSVAKHLLETNHFIDALELVQGGTITHVYPLEGNEAAIGYNILDDSAVNREARMALDKRQLYFAGPIRLKQGYEAIVGRLPIFVNDRYWGFAAVLIRLSTILKAAELDNTHQKDYIFQLSKRDPNTGKEQFFLPNASLFRKENSASVDVMEGDWRIYARFRKPEALVSLLPFMIIGLLFAISGGWFAWYGARQPYRLQKQVEEKTRLLRASEEKYFSFFEKASDTIIVTDVNGTILDVNLSVCNLLGYAREELVGRKIDRFIEQDSLRPATTGMQPDEATPAPIHERRMIRKNGDIVELEVNEKMIDGNNYLAIGRDLTGLRKVQKQIALSESTLRGAFEFSATGMALVGADGKWLKVNKALCTMLGYTPDELLSMSFQDVTHPDDLESGIEFLKDAAQSNASQFRTEKRYLHKSGSLIWANLNVSSVREADGRFLYFVAQTEDISEKRKMLELLEVRERQLRLFIEHSPAALAMFDTDMRYMITSKRWISDYELEGKQVIGSKHYDLFPNIPDRWKAIHQKCLKGAVEMSDEDYYVDDLGRSSWLKWEIHPWRKYDGEIGGIIMFTEVITRIKEAELKFRNLVEQSLVGVCIVQNEKFAYVNPCFAKMYGYSPDEMIETFPAETVIAPEYRGIVNNTVSARLRGDLASVHYEVQGIRKDHSRIDVEAYGSVTTYNGRPAIIASILDITERKKAQAVIRESEEKFRNLVEKSLAGVYIIQDGVVKYINPAHEKIMGYSLQELQQMENIEDLIYEEDLATFRENHQPHRAETEEQHQYTLRAIRKDGTIVYLEIITSEIIFEGRPALIGTMLNVTNRTEEEIRINKAVNDAQEQERIQIGMELHDNVKQILAASLMNIDFIRSSLDNPAMAAKLLTDLKKYTNEAIDELRRLSHQLAPSINKNDSLYEKIEKLIHSMNTGNQLEVSITVDELEEPLSTEVQTAFYRILQEQLNNIVKYANAKSVSISIRKHLHGIVLTISDDGQGFDPTTKKDGIGLENIRRRAFVLGGKVKMITSPGHGCEIQVQIPTGLPS